MVLCRRHAEDIMLTWMFLRYLAENYVKQAQTVSDKRVIRAQVSELSICLGSNWGSRGTAETQSN